MRRIWKASMVTPKEKKKLLGLSSVDRRVEHATLIDVDSGLEETTGCRELITRKSQKDVP